MAMERNRVFGMDFNEAANAITSALVADRVFSTVTIDSAGSVTLDAPMENDAVIAPPASCWRGKHR